ncbi:MULTISPECIES: phage shock protein PspA [Aeromonas]|uniref:Phage shock protein PspA n=1 Tax=Aeromonas allosaccharophila TaxID=656 RepID=A0AAX3NXQ8_9GAMM|nr:MULTISPECIES: phage shock protein PspA [Aeromonas]EKP0295962.1 phage shock protein PspA [Aeromonas veronii]KZW96953.1 phage shock protein A [Aeromonas veronii]MBL0564046.1 phage shock protein PspA [Aeromonas veronii]MBL0594300.1 phage shock protein PspA [Aeromonas veronii]MBS4695989.1 phage shock protein PspA [Aeromonas allosaccharophila]
MSIFSRLADIINSNLTALLDKAEDPQKMVRLIIQEMEDELVKERSNLARFLASQKEIGRQVARHQERVDEWQAKAELALTKGREDLARAALIEKKKQTELSETLYREQQAVDSGIEKLGEEIRQLEAKLEDARARQKAMAIRTEAASSRLNVQSQVARGESQAVVSKFERMERRIDEMEARADLGQSDKALAQQFAELEVDDQISKELEAMRQKLGQGDSKSEGKQGE